MVAATLERGWEAERFLGASVRVRTALIALEEALDYWRYYESGVEWEVVCDPVSDEGRLRAALARAEEEIEASASAVRLWGSYLIGLGRGRLGDWLAGSRRLLAARGLLGGGRVGGAIRVLIERGACALRLAQGDYTGAYELSQGLERRVILIGRTERVLGVGARTASTLSLEFESGVLSGAFLGGGGGFGVDVEKVSADASECDRARRWLEGLAEAADGDWFKGVLAVVESLLSGVGVGVEVEERLVVEGACAAQVASLIGLLLGSGHRGGRRIEHILRALTGQGFYRARVERYRLIGERLRALAGVGESVVIEERSAAGEVSLGGTDLVPEGVVRASEAEAVERSDLEWEIGHWGWHAITGLIGHEGASGRLEITVERGDGAALLGWVEFAQGGYWEAWIDGGVASGVDDSGAGVLLGEHSAFGVEALWRLYTIVERHYQAQSGAVLSTGRAVVAGRSLRGTFRRYGLFEISEGGRLGGVRATAFDFELARLYDEVRAGVKTEAVAVSELEQALVSACAPVGGGGDTEEIDWEAFERAFTPAGDQREEKREERREESAPEVAVVGAGSTASVVGGDFLELSGAIGCELIKDLLTWLQDRYCDWVQAYIRTRTGYRLVESLGRGGLAIGSESTADEFVEILRERAREDELFGYELGIGYGLVYRARRAEVSGVVRLLFRAWEWSHGAAVGSVEVEGVEFVYGDVATEQLLWRVRRLAEHDGLEGRPVAHVLLIGERGVGKERIAKLIHDWSGRRARPYIVCNGAVLGLNATLATAEFFGAEPGAYTDAPRQGRRGLIEQAGDGTLFIDEVNELTPEVTGLLKRVVQEGDYARLGSTQRRRAQCRFVLATNRPERLPEDVRDRFYQLEIPPLRVRRGDIGPLARHFAAQYGCGIDAKLIEYLERLEWPGNVRQLERTIYEMATFAPRAGDGYVLSLRDLEAARGLRVSAGQEVVERARAGVGVGEVVAALGAERDAGLDLGCAEALLEWSGGDLGGASARFRRLLIEAALLLEGGNRTRAARRLGITRQGLRKLLERDKENQSKDDRR